MNVSELGFPVLTFNRFGPSIFRRADDLTSTFASSLRQGWFDGLEIVDSRGKTFTVQQVRTVGSIGPFWGLSLFFSRRLRVDLTLRESDRPLSLEDVKARLARSFDEWEGWQARGDFPELKARVEAARTVGELIDAIS